MEQKERDMEELVQRAYNLAAEALKNETRYDGSAFLEHPAGVADIVENEIGLPAECVAAVYLHEATRLHKDIDLKGFPREVLNIVDGLNKISTIKPKDTRLEAESYKKLIVQYSADPRVTVIKIADRLEVMRSLSIFPKASREQKILETLMLYIPLAHQLGLYNIKGELENIYFRHAEPEQYRAITNKLKATERDRERIAVEFIRPLEQKLTDAGIKYKMKVRTKSAYSIYKKMSVQKVPFEGVYDVFAMRFIIDAPDDAKAEKDLCWKVYSFVTEEYEPDVKRLRDWVTNPKPNGYESLHITVKNKRGAHIEVQIRTKRMDDEAENGHAAHWSYKGIKHEASLDRWLQSVRYNLEHPFEPGADELPQVPSREIFVFTPTGELKILSMGASVLDFAFLIHSGLGCKCTGGRVNGKAVSIKEKLKTGDVVEIMTSKSQKPSQDWLNWVVSSKARSKIRQELDAVERKHAAEGRELLERRLKNWKLDFSDELTREFMKQLKYNSLLTMFADLGLGKIDVNRIKAFILQKQTRQSSQAEITRESEWTGQGSARGSDDILVLNAKDVKGIDYKMARCCNPVFGDDVFGFVTRTEGIKIHRISCPNASRLIENYPYRIQRVRWADNPSTGDFQCSLKIIAELEHSVLGKVMEVVGNFKASIRNFNVKEDTGNGVYDITMRLLVPSNMELDKVISQISALKTVIKVKRV